MDALSFSSRALSALGSCSMAEDFMIIVAIKLDHRYLMYIENDKLYVVKLYICPNPSSKLLIYNPKGYSVT